MVIYDQIITEKLLQIAQAQLERLDVVHADIAGKVCGIVLGV